jgi:bacterioferritin-associated ferredoxin
MHLRSPLAGSLSPLQTSKSHSQLLQLDLGAVGTPNNQVIKQSFLNSMLQMQKETASQNNASTGGGQPCAQCEKQIQQVLARARREASEGLKEAAVAQQRAELLQIELKDQQDQNMHLKASYDALLHNIVNRSSSKPSEDNDNSTAEQLVQAKIELELLRREFQEMSTFKDHLQNTLQERTRLLESLRSDCEQSVKREQRLQRDFEDISLRMDRDRRVFEESHTSKNRELEGALK